MAPDTTVQIKGSLRFLNTTYLYMNKKPTLAMVLLLNDLPDDVHSAPTLAFLENS